MWPKRQEHTPQELTLESLGHTVESVVDQKRTRAMLIRICCCLSLLLIIPAAILFFISRSNANDIHTGISTLGTNWKSDLVFEIRNDPNQPIPDGFYLDKWRGSFPGTNSDCYCPFSTSRVVNQGYLGRSCFGVDENIYCSNIPATSSATLNTWYDNQIIYVLRARGSSFMDTYKFMNQDGTCQTGFHQCGDKNSRSKGSCVPNTAKGCPISDITSAVVPPLGYTQVAFRGFALSYINDPNRNAVVDTLFSEHHLCFSRGDFGITPGRKRYKPLKGSSDACVPDETAIPLGELGEAELFKLNGIDYSKYINYEVSNNYIYKLFAARQMQWSPSCAEDVASIDSKSGEVESLHTSFTVLFVLFILFLIFFTIFGVILVCAQVAVEEGGQHSKLCLWIFFLLSLVCFIMILPSMIIVYIKTNDLQSYFSSVVEKQCGDAYTNSNFQKTSDMLSSTVTTYVRWWFWLLIAAFAVFLGTMIPMMISNTHTDRLADDFEADFVETMKPKPMTDMQRTSPTSPTGNNQMYARNGQGYPPNNQAYVANGQANVSNSQYYNQQPQRVVAATPQLSQNGQQASYQGSPTYTNQRIASPYVMNSPGPAPMGQTYMAHSPQYQQR